jgi:hypothetical protein
VDESDHRRRTIRRWLCLCGQRFPCGAYLYHRDRRTREVHPGGPAGAALVGWNIHRSPAR